MKVYFIIDALVYDQNDQLSQKWESTHTSIEGAEDSYQQQLNNNRCVSVSITEWKADFYGDLTHGSWAIRSCAGGVPNCVVVKHASRPTSKACPFEKNVLFVHGDWIHEGSINLGPTSSAPGFKLKPIELKREAQMYLKYAHMVKDSTCLVINDAQSQTLVDESEMQSHLNCLKNWDGSVRKPLEIIKLYEHKTNFQLVLA